MDWRPSQTVLILLHNRIVNISCQDAASSDLPDNSLDAVFTDPPYYGNVQYAELMDFCYVWLKRLVGQTSQSIQCCFNQEF